MFLGLYVRGDAIEISSLLTPIRVLAGMEFYFRAPETSIEVSRDPAVQNWIVLTGSRDGREVKLALAPGKWLHEAWDALVSAGAEPVGPAPLHRFVG